MKRSFLLITILGMIGVVLLIPPPPTPDAAHLVLATQDMNWIATLQHPMDQAITTATNPALEQPSSLDAVNQLPITAVILALIALMASYANPFLTWLNRTQRGRHRSTRSSWRSPLIFQ